MTSSTTRKPLDLKVVQTLEAAFAEFNRDGVVSSVRCDRCNDVLVIERLGESAFSIDCRCGKFKDTIRGL